MESDIPFEDRYLTTGVEVQKDGKIISLLDTVEGELYIFCDPPYEDTKHGVPTMWDNTRCLKIALHSDEAVQEAMEWTQIAMIRHGGGSVG